MARDTPPRSERRRLTHVDRSGRPRMVDVSDKPATARRAVAEALVAVSPETMSMVIDGGGAKGDVLGVAELAGVMGGKQTSELIPLCHPLALTDLVVAVTPDRVAGVLRVRAEAATTGPTGVEMEALTAASVAALTIYDMVKGVERGVEIRAVRLVSKTGGKSGEWHRPADVEAERRRTSGGREPAPPAGSVEAPRRRPEGVTDASRRAASQPRRTALVLTASDRSAAGTRDDTQRRRAGRAAHGARLRGPAVGRRGRPGRDRAGSPRRGRGSPADRDDRRHRPDPARRHAAGDARRDRLRGAGAGRGDPRRGPARDAVRRAEPGGRRRPRPDPDREHPGLAQGRRGVARGDRRGSRSCPRDARRPP